ncbi:flagellar basal body P-ring formation chaperone FlgA [Chitinibacteraceae bacterium HSL-7]
MKRFIMAALLLAGTAPALAAWQDRTVLDTELQTWLDGQLARTPGARARLGQLDDRLRLQACKRLDFALPQGARLAGNVLIEVRCAEGAAWRIRYPVHVAYSTRYLIAARPLAAGKTLSADDFSVMEGDIASVPGSVVTDEQMALGQTLTVAMAPGAVLKSEMLRAGTVVRQNQKVRVMAVFDGIEISNDGVALNNAGAGDVVRVRVGRNRIISGIASPDGSVRVGQ